MSKPRIKLALGSYDRHGPLLEGTVQHADFDFRFLELDPRQGRHERFLRDLEFDACELSFSSYMVAVDRGAPVHAVPIFPRRLFSQSQMYKNLKSGIDAPEDLVGKRVGLSSYQNTLGVRAKGDIAHLYGIPWKSITWVSAGDDAVPVELPDDVVLERVKDMAEMEDQFVNGSIHALFVSRLPRPFIHGDPRIARLFSDPRAEEERCLKEEGYFPIMHVLAFKRELAKQFPGLPEALFEIFEQARSRALQRWNDPNWSMLLWGRTELERQRTRWARDPWSNGLEVNRRDIERFAQYSYEQGLTKRRLHPEELFVSIDTQRSQESP